MLIPVLDRTHYVRAIRQPSNPGWNPTTHLARLRFGDGVERATYVKVEGGLAATLGNEAIAWVLAKGLDLAAPSHAAFLIEEVGWFRSILGERYPTDTYFPQSGLVGAWCTTDLGGSPVRTLSSIDDLSLQALLRSEAGAKIVAFDQWLGNEDRNTGNLIRIEKGRMALIDHGVLFCYKDWRKQPIHPDCSSHLWSTAVRLHRDNKLTVKDMNQLRSGMIEFSLSHGRVAGECHPAITQIISELENPTAASNVLSCIAERSFRLWMRNEVGNLL